MIVRGNEDVKGWMLRMLGVERDSGDVEVIRVAKDALAPEGRREGDAGAAGDAGGFPLQRLLVKSDHLEAVARYWEFRINLCKLSN